MSRVEDPASMNPITSAMNDSHGGQSRAFIDMPKNQLKELLHNFGVRKFVSAFISCNGAADGGELIVPKLLRMPRSIAVGYEGCPLLESGVSEAQDCHWVLTMPDPMRYWMVFSTWRMLTRPDRKRKRLSRSPWRFSSAVQERVQRPQAVGLAPVSSRVPSSVLSMRLLGHHVADEADEVVVGQLAGALPEVRDVVQERLAGGVGEVVRRLPAALHGLEQREQRVGRPGLQGGDELQAVRRDGVHHLLVSLQRR
eukprot:SM000063S20076  [mRNA]  locus=s63:592059:596146:- [translate_table: standard]